MIIPVIEAAMTGWNKLPHERDTVYVIDPDEAIRDGLTTFLGTLDIPVRSYSNAEAFVDSHTARSLSQGCLLVDANLHGMGSLALLRQLRAQRVDLPVVVLASTSNRHIADQVFEAGAVDVIEKPRLDSVLVDRLRQLMIRAPGLAAAAPRSFTLRNGTEVSIRAIQPGSGSEQYARQEKPQRSNNSAREYPVCREKLSGHRRWLHRDR